MWNQPYLETCCRSALHRLVLCGEVGRPGDLKDGPCLTRLADMGLARQREDGRFEITAAGRARHAQEILNRAEA
jgi:DNA-binding transcriptional regulator PaaX